MMVMATKSSPLATLEAPVLHKFHTLQSLLQSLLLLPPMGVLLHLQRCYPEQMTHIQLQYRRRQRV